MYNFDNVALLITVYNRSSSLERLLRSFKELNLSFGEIIVSDDASKARHLEAMKSLEQEFNFKLITTPKNGGLGNNINKGQRAVAKPFTLYVQEDFVPKPEFIEVFNEAYKILEKDATIDTIRFYSYFPYPYVKPYNEIFDEMKFQPSFFKWSHLKFYMYSDHPHLRRSDFIEKFGPYIEGHNVNVTEFDMSLSYIKKGGRALLVKHISEIFDQKNSPDEPSTANRSSWKERDSFLIKGMRRFFLIYRYIKNNIQLSKKSR